MKIIDRFTRDRVSRYVWAVLTVGCLLGWFSARQGQTTALRDQLSAAQAQTRHIADTVLFNNLSHDAMTNLIPSPLYRDIYVALQSQVFTDATVARVRVWTPDGILQYSTHERDQVGLLQTQDKTLIDQAMKGQSVSAKVLTKFSAASTGNDQTPTNLLEVFVPLHVPDWISVTGVVEVDYYYDHFVQAAHQPWFNIMLGLLGLAVLCLLMTLLSFRPPVGTQGAGVASGSEVEGAEEPKRGGKHAVAPPSDEAAKALQREAERADARATKAEADALSLREELKGSRNQLKEAEAKIAAKSVDGPSETSQPHENELKREIVLTARAHAAEASLREAKRRAQAAEKKTKKLEERARTAEAAVASTTSETSEAAGDGAVAQASQAAAEAALAAKEAESAAASVAAEEAAAAMAAQQVQPQAATPAADDDAVFVKLEERIAAAERRASDAEARLLRLRAVSSAPRDEPPEDAVTATAGDLRSRLARTAARKKLGADDGTAATAAAAEAEAARSAGNPDRPSGDPVDPTPDP